MVLNIVISLVGQDGFYGILPFVGYLMANPLYTYDIWF